MKSSIHYITILYIYIYIYRNVIGWFAFLYGNSRTTFSDLAVFKHVKSVNKS